MTGTSSSAAARALRWAPLLAAAVAWLLRAPVLFARGGAWSYGVDYDEGVYFTAASLLWKGAWPWRDFVFVHPPGLLAWLALPAGLGHLGLGPSAGFALARWLSTFAGAASVGLVFVLARRRAGPVAAAVAALALALYPETVGVDRGAYLEPVLNLACLAMALALDRAEDAPARRTRWLRAAGALAGFAVAVKLWAVLWVLAALVPLWRLGRARALAQFALPAAAVGAAFALPGVALDARAFFEQLVTFHSLRPPDGIVARTERLTQIFHWRHAGTDALALLGFAVALVRREARARAGLLPWAWLLTLAAFLAAPSYWEQYNAHLGPTAAVLAGLGAGWLWGLARRHGAPLRVAAAVLLLGALVPSAVHTRRTFGHTRELLQLGALLRAEVLPTQPVCAFEPAWLLAADRLPPRLESVGYLVDTYALQLLDAERSGQRFDSAAAAFESPASQATISRALARCEVAVLGWRGRFQLAAPLEDEIVGRWPRLADGEGPDVHRRP